LISRINNNKNRIISKRKENNRHLLLPIEAVEELGVGS